VNTIRIAGLDIGSRTIKLVLLENGAICDFQIIDTGHDPLLHSQELLSKCEVDTIVATGYGRYLAKTHFANSIITEIKAYAIGAHYLFPKCRTIIDVGGQDSKVIRVDERGRTEDFEMNDRCAAGTGKFLEVMAKTLDFKVEEFGDQALKAKHPVNISSTCTVFSESEVISLIANGEDRKNIALGVHQAIVNRLAAMANKIGLKEDVVFAGGVAKNNCIASLLEKETGVKLFIPEEPQIVGALGAALTAK
jgi:predicted CoA-substrate-specific enzyme activase